MSLRIDVNADLGEEVTDDEALLAVVTSANVACGFHAGTIATMQSVCRGAVRQGVQLGAHVSYQDRANFGRQPMQVAPAVIQEWVSQQFQTLSKIAAEAGTQVRYIKPHGALYHQASTDVEVARAVLAATADLPVVGMPGSVLLELAARAGRRAVGEGFPDRGYTAAGDLIPRGQAGALVAGEDQVAAQAVRLAADPQVETLCVHGDSPGALHAAEAVCAALLGVGFAVASWLPLEAEMGSSRPEA